MEQQYSNTGFPDQRPVMNSTLKVLTILSIIGCIIQFISTIWGFISAKSNYDKLEETMSMMNSSEMPGWARSMMGNPEDYRTLITKSFENRIPILLLSIVAIGLCFYGVLEMRKLKKQGFTFYVIGELLPILTAFLFLGGLAMKGFMFYFGFGIAALFIILYASQRKQLVY
jgi:hypothetical protein